MPHKTIEIEFRARFNKAEYDRLHKFLSEHAEDLGKDDKDVHFFVLPDRLVKVVHNTSHISAKVVLKLSKIGRGSSFEEIEYPILPEHVPDAIRFFENLGMEGMSAIHSFQKRHNYQLDGVEIALKFSENWQHHLELEIVVDDLDKKEEAEGQIFAVAKKLGVTLMTDEELRDFTESVMKEHGSN